MTGDRTRMAGAAGARAENAQRLGRTRTALLDHAHVGTTAAVGDAVRVLKGGIGAMDDPAVYRPGGHAETCAKRDALEEAGAAPASAQDAHAQDAGRRIAAYAGVQGGVALAGARLLAAGGPGAKRRTKR